jgi:hypothetical protein
MSFRTLRDYPARRRAFGNLFIRADTICPARICTCLIFVDFRNEQDWS